METMFFVLATAGWRWGWLLPLGWIALFALFLALALRGRWWRSDDAGTYPTRSAEAVLGERYARGEIDEREYRERLSVLRERG